MPTYAYQCRYCGGKKEVLRSMRDKEIVPYCTCSGETMNRDYESERVNAGDREYRRPIVSHSLAVSPQQVGEHRRAFPDIKITDEGCPVFSSYRQHDAYLKKIGAVKQPQKIRNRGKRIATQGK